jgi:hypothetical protein
MPFMRAGKLGHEGGARRRNAGETYMKAALLLAVTIVTFSSLPLTARPGGSDAQATASPAAPRPPIQAQTTTRPGIRPVVAELLGGLDAAAARRGDPVFATTEGDGRTSQGILIPKGTHLIGHVRDVHPQSSDHENSSLSIAFDLADLVGGQRLRIHSVIQAVTPSAAEAPLSRTRATEGPAILLAGASGTLSSPGGNVCLASGTRLILSLTAED